MTLQKCLNKDFLFKIKLFFLLSEESKKDPKESKKTL